MRQLYAMDTHHLLYGLHYTVVIGNPCEALATTVALASHPCLLFQMGARDIKMPSYCMLSTLTLY